TRPSADEMEKNTKWLPSANLYTNEEIHAGFNLLRVSPLNNADLHYELLIPTSWKSADINVTPDELAKDSRIQIPLARLAPPEADRVITEVRYQRLPQTVSAEDFLKLYAQNASLQVLARQHGQFKGS